MKITQKLYYILVRYNVIFVNACTNSNVCKKKSNILEEHDWRFHEKNLSKYNIPLSAKVLFPVPMSTLLLGVT